MTYTTFSLDGTEYIALCDLLKVIGVADSGGQAKSWITAGQVLRNGAPETRKTAKIRSGDTITVGDTIICVNRHE